MGGFFISYIESRFGVSPKQIPLYVEALTHASANGRQREVFLRNNERLEFLGDAVIELVVSEYIYVKYPDMQEGDLTRLRARLVCRSSINEWAKELEVDRAMQEVMGFLPEAKHLLGDALEALVGAIYLDLGLEAARRALEFSILCGRVDWEDTLEHLVDYKSLVLQWAQRHQHTVTYELSQITEQPSRFNCALIVDGMARCSALRGTKKEAQMHACRLFLQEENIED